MTKTKKQVALSIKEQGTNKTSTLNIPYNSNILNICQNHHIRVESYCGGALDCLSCIIYISDRKAISISGQKEVKLLKENEHTMTQNSEMKNWHKRFACQCKIKQNCTIFIPKNDETSDYEI